MGGAFWGGLCAVLCCPLTVSKAQIDMAIALMMMLFVASIKSYISLSYVTMNGPGHLIGLMLRSLIFISLRHNDIYYLP